jgi:hypothetical protein
VLSSPTDAVLSWTGVDADAAGTVVEFATEPAGPFTVLGFVPPQQSTFKHPDLIPQTTFFYRIRPYYGPASTAVAVTLPAGNFDENAHRDDPDWGAPRTGPGSGSTGASVRDRASAGPATPVDLRATVMDPNGIRFTWTDRARDEEGYLLEVKGSGRTEYGVAAVLDPDVTSYGLVTMPDEKIASYRVRAYCYGPASNIVHQTTGLAQSQPAS